VTIILCALSHQADARGPGGRNKPRPPTQAEFSSDPSAGNVTAEVRKGAKPMLNLVKDAAVLKRLKPTKKLTTQPNKIVLAPAGSTNSTSAGRQGRPMLVGRATTSAMRPRRPPSKLPQLTESREKPSAASSPGNQRNLLAAALEPQHTEAATAVIAAPHPRWDWIPSIVCIAWPA
jgi:hypothetical protein